MTERKYPTCDAPREDAEGGVFFGEREGDIVKIGHLMSEDEMQDGISQIAKDIVKDCSEDGSFVLIGIRTRGIPMAEWVGRELSGISPLPVLVGSIDINLYRDDLSEVDDQPVVKKTELPFSITGKGVILFDDVLYTGRTIRSAMDALIDFGRPKYVKLAVMIDRGFRELPIQADYIGRKIETRRGQNVKVMFKSTDGKNEIVVKG